MDGGAMVGPDTVPTDPYTQDAITFGRLILMAYKMSGQGLTPPLPPDFPKDYEIIKNVIMDDYGTPTFYGFLARLKKPNTNNCVLVIRGTLGLTEWLIDLQSMLPTPFHNFGWVGSGFADTYDSIYLWPKDPTIAAAAPQANFAAQVAAALETHTAQSEPALPAPRLSLAGHSLGSALVTLYAVHRLIVSAIPLDKFYTFASPLVGDSTFRQAFDALGIKDAYRIFDDWDPVPKLPPIPWFEPVAAARPFNLSSRYNGWDPLCAHSMDTYLNHFDPSHPAAYACRHVIPMDAPRAPAMAGLTMAKAVLAEPAAVTKVVSGTTTITITIQTSGG